MANEAKSGGCVVCGESDLRCLDLHHKDPSKKKFTLSISNYSRTEEAWKEEIEKCITLCANCHRKLHSGDEYEFPEVVV